MDAFKVEHHAMLFAWLAREAMQRFGAEGEQAIREGVRRYGGGRGKRMAARARAAGHRPDFLRYLLYGEINFAETGNQTQIMQKTPHVEVEARRCDWDRAWREHGMLDYGRLYCQEIDRAILRGFNPDFRFAVDGTLSNGAPCCRFIYYDGRLGLLEMLRYLWGKRRIGTRATRAMEFHVVDLYRSLAQTLAERFGDAGREAVQAALGAFASEYGMEAVEALQKVAREYDTNVAI